jgi:hypothetical protein
MPNHEDLVQALAQLDPADMEEVITTAYRRRLDPTVAATQARPEPEATPEQFARWLAHRHLSSDAAVDRVVYLPAGDLDNEIRLLEINRFLNPPDPDVVEPLDFSPDIDGLPYKVFVADITTDQWERIQRAPEAFLPAGWDLTGHQIITRDETCR